MLIWANPDKYPPTINAANFLDEDGFTVFIVGRSRLGVLEQNAKTNDSITVVRVFGGISNRFKRGLSIFHFIYTSIWIFFKISPASVIAYDNIGLIAGGIIKIISSSFKLVYHNHDVNFNYKKFSFNYFAILLEKIFIKKTSLIIFPDSLRSINYLHEINLPNDNRLLLVPNAPRLRVNKISICCTWPPETNLNNKKILIRHGNVGPGHGLEAIIKSMPLWQSDIVFIVIGPSEFNYAESLKALAADLCVLNNFLIMPPVNYPEIIDIVAQASVGSAIYDGLIQNTPWGFAGTASNKALEFVSAGIPFLVDRHPGSDIFVKSGLAISVNPENAYEIASAITELTKADKLKEIRSKALRLHRDILNFEHGFAKVKDFLDKL